MQRVRARLIADRKEEVEGVAKMIYNEKQARGEEDQTDGFADWVEAENRVIRTTFERQTGCSLSLTASMLVLLSGCLLLPPTYKGAPLLHNHSAFLGNIAYTLLSELSFRLFSQWL